MTRPRFDLVGLSVRDATPHRRLDRDRYKPTWLDILDLAAYTAACVIVVVAFRVLI